jgi:hypothetical protein
VRAIEYVTEILPLATIANRLTKEFDEALPKPAGKTQLAK